MPETKALAHLLDSSQTELQVPLTLSHRSLVVLGPHSQGAIPRRWQCTPTTRPEHGPWLLVQWRISCLAQPIFFFFFSCAGSSLPCAGSLVAVSRGYSPAAVLRLLTVVASLVEGL